MKVLFLDFDGVINNHRTPGTVGEYLRPLGGDPLIKLPVEPACAEVLNGILREHALQVVLSTSWRIVGTHQDLARSLAAHGIAADVIGATADAMNDPEWALRRRLDHRDRLSRGDEIRDWLEHHLDEVEAFVILDDCFDMPGMRETLVHTDGAVGLVSSDVELVPGCLAASRRVLDILRRGVP